ncbi:DUF1284 domain-containing protein [Mesorhizobium sp. 1B3]|uniref:DUF1284 domain-containing protein n=1 Tax=Mesorhizobium sp. 1B3 TaxID=3243599 RepID=UPI003D9747C6
MINMRGHHLLCVLTFQGAGYNPRFTRNLAAIVERLSAGEEILIVAGPDDICAPVLDDADSHCGLVRVEARDALALDAVSALIGRPLSPGDTLYLDAPTVQALRSSFAEGTVRAACEDCDWHGLCSRIAAHGFGSTKLLPVS